MKKISTANITTAVGMPIKSGSIQHIQSAYQECLNHLAKNAFGSVDSATVYVLWGVVNIGTNYSEGAVYFNGEIYYVPATSFTPGAGEVAVANITTSYFSAANADPVQFTDGVSYNVHEIRQVELTSGTSGSGIADFADFVRSDWNIAEVTADMVITDGTGTISHGYIKYKRQGDMVTLNYNISVNISGFSGGAGDFLCTLPLPFTAVVDDPGYIPAAAMMARRHSTADLLGVAYIQETATDTLKLQFFGTTTTDYLLRGQITYQTA